jgi:hypothetical protein
MIPEVKLTKESVWGSWYSNTDRNYQGEAIIEFESANRLRNFINDNHQIVKSNGITFKITKRKKSRATKFHCEVQALTLRELNLEKLGI